MLAADYPFLDLFWTMLLFFLWIMWIWLLITIFGDIFRRHDASGWVKALWVVFLIFVPFLGVLVYLIAEGQNMARRDMEQAAAARAEFDEYVRSVARSEGQQPTSSPPSA